MREREGLVKRLGSFGVGGGREKFSGREGGIGKNFLRWVAESDQEEKFSGIDQSGGLAPE
jgi:hypothetical protein